MDSNHSQPTTHTTWWSKWVSGIGLGLAIGTGISLATQNILLGSSVGVAICIAIVVMKSR